MGNLNTFNEKLRILRPGVIKNEIHIVVPEKENLNIFGYLFYIFD